MKPGTVLRAKVLKVEPPGDDCRVRPRPTQSVRSRGQSTRALLLRGGTSDRRCCPHYRIGLVIGLERIMQTRAAGSSSAAMRHRRRCGQLKGRRVSSSTLWPQGNCPTACWTISSSLQASAKARMCIIFHIDSMDFDVLRSLASTEATTFFTSFVFIRWPVGKVTWVFRHEAGARSAAVHGSGRAFAVSPGAVLRGRHPPPACS